MSLDKEPTFSCISLVFISCRKSGLEGTAKKENVRRSQPSLHIPSE